MPLQATSGAASYDGFGGGVAAVPNYIEDVFSTYLYTGNGGTQTITNSIDLSTKGGLVWIKQRDSTAISGGLPSQHLLFDTNRGANNMLASNSTYQSLALGGYSFNNTGFTVAQYTNTDGTYPYEGNQSSVPYASWTFRKQPKFFDVVTYTGNGVAGRQIAHNLGSVPGCIIVKSTSTATMWPVYHRSLGATKYLGLNTTDAQATNSAWWNNTEPTATAFTVGTTQSTNQNTLTYVAYIFAHNAGGFGLTGTDNVISCGSYTLDGSNPTTVNLGYEPQFLIWKASSTTGNWFTSDNMRGLTTSNCSLLFPNLSNGESTGSTLQSINATGFTAGSTTAGTYIYIAIRRGPMKVPTSGTSVFSPNAVNAATGTSVTTNFPVDLQITTVKTGGNSRYVFDRLRGISTNSTESGQILTTDTTNVEQSSGSATLSWGNQGFKISSAWANADDIFWNFKRTPSFFDEVCYTGTGAALTQAHNLGVVPELIIEKGRSSADAWWTYHSALGNTQAVALQSTNAASTSINFWNNTSPTATQFTVGSSGSASGATKVAYLFATCAGVSKVGSYTGNGSSQTINCGFTGGARFVLIKRTDSTGDWYVWDTARGIVTANDPHLSLNTTAAEVTTDDTIDTASTGFIVNQDAATNVNVSSATYIYLAIA